MCEHACVKDIRTCSYSVPPLDMISKPTLLHHPFIHNYIITWYTPYYIIHTWLHYPLLITLPTPHYITHTSLLQPSTLSDIPYHAVIIFHTLTQIMFKQSVLIRKLWGRRRARRWGTRHLHLCLKWGEHGIKLIQWGVHVWHLLVQMYPKH